MRHKPTSRVDSPVLEVSCVRPDAKLPFVLYFKTQHVTETFYDLLNITGPIFDPFSGEHFPSWTTVN